jgi:RNA polymerase sigma-70 factor (ECF subfamily)
VRIAVAEHIQDAELARAIMAAPPGEARREEAALCVRMGRRVLAYGRRHLSDDAAAADLAQRVLLLTIEKLRAGQVREPERIGSFVLGAARTLSLEMLRHGAREAAPLPKENGPDVVVAEPEALGQDRLKRCLESLPVRDRTVVVLTYFGDQEAGSIGASLGLAPGNVRVIRHRAIDRLRQCMGLLEETA